MISQARLTLLPLALGLALAACSQPAPDSNAAASAPAPATEAAEAPAIEGVSGTYVIDPNHTDVIAQWNHFGFSNPIAHFGGVEGAIVFDADDVSASSVEVAIPLSQLNSHVAAFDEHLKNADFFDVERFPTATFRSTGVEAAGANRLKVTGELTLKGVTREVVLDTTINGFGEQPMAKRPAAGFDASATIKRSDFDLGLYAPNVSDEVQLRITTEAVVAAAEDAPASE